MTTASHRRRVRASTTVTDFMIIATGTSRTHVRAMVERVLEEADVRRLRPLGVEGRESGEWVLVDLADVVVHVMQEDARGFYDLERLWQPFPESRTEPADPRPAETGAN